MSQPRSSDSIPSVIPVPPAPKAPPRRKQLRSADAVPWMPITIGATVLFMVAIVVMAVYFIKQGDRQALDEGGVPGGPPVIRLDRAPDVPKVVAVAKVEEPREELDALPLNKGDFVDCQQIGTDVRFLKEPAEAFKRARAEKKMVFMMHLSGNLEDKEFT